MNIFRRYFRNISHQRGTAQFLLLCLRHSQQWLHHKVLSKVAVICVIIVDREDMMTHLKDCLVESPSMAGSSDGDNEVEGVKVFEPVPLLLLVDKQWLSIFSSFAFDQLL